ncbi:methylenetetrahydrofolate reductase [Fructobacillus sp. M1-13]|uniref:Methylenetetrahydrofolate reductase n=1 Tax=Fructobacillus papyriferae TaxID=2713171 RepID=A0ABS5QQC3_9LACO|nr:methylenetetrahydrofolate reductase [Fructobacillus papyriferae]MBS9335306.1 hypothetical protein [Fructobacillus papyriferae]MCD2159025.1 methylenetetrahydrofolate reductase [Fructobacillus papyriferae]
MQKISDLISDDEEIVQSQELTVLKAKQLLACLSSTKSMSSVVSPSDRTDIAVKKAGSASAISYYSLVNQGKEEKAFDQLLDLAEEVQKATLRPVLIHLRAGDLSPTTIKDFVDQVIARGLCNFLVLSGDYRMKADGYRNGQDLLLALRQAGGEKLALASALLVRQPVTKAAILRVKEKLAAGTDFFLTQICFDSKALIDLQKACFEAGLPQVPVVVGILQKPTMKQLNFVSAVLGLNVPKAYRANPAKEAAAVEQTLLAAGFSAFHHFSLPNR